MPKDSSIPGRQCAGQYASFGDVPGVGGMPNVGAMPKGSTVDVLCGGAMPQVGGMPNVGLYQRLTLLICHVVALCRRS